MKDTIQRRVFSNYSIGLIGFIITFLQTLITVPILLKYWGNDIYGIWIALFAGFNLLQTLDFGHQTFVGNLLNIEYHINKDNFSTYLGSSLSIAIILGCLELLLTIIFIATGYLNEFLGLAFSEKNYFVISVSMLSLMSMWLIAGSVGGILVKILIPAGFMGQNLVWGTIFKLAQFLSLILVAISGGKILEASIVYSIVQLILAFFVFRYIKNKMPEFYPWWKSKSFKIGFYNFKKSSVITINNLLQQLTSNGLILFITNVFSSSIVPAFTTVRTLTNSAAIFTNLFITSIQPDLIKYHARRETEKLQSTLNANWFFSGLVVNFSLIIIIPFAKQIFKIWTKGLINFDFNLFISLAASISLINYGAGLYNYIYGINNLRAVTVITLARVIILFIFSYYLSGIFGLGGIGIAILISEIFASMILPYFYVQKILKSFNGSLDLKTTFTSMFSPLILIFLVVFELFWMKFSYYIWVISLLLIILIYVFNWITLDKEVKDRTLNLLRNLY